MKIIESLSSVLLALKLLVIIILVSFAGCFIPGVYQSWWFVLILAIFALNIFLCSLKRLKFGKRRLGSTLVHLSVIVILLGAGLSFLKGVRGAIELYEGETKDSFISEKGSHKLPFKVHLDDFSLQWYRPSFYKLTVYVVDKGIKRDYSAIPAREYEIKGTPYSFKVLNYLADFSIEENRVVKNLSDQPNNPALLVQINSGKEIRQRWVFSNYPHMGAQDENIVFFFDGEGLVKEFRSSISIIDGGRQALAGVLKVNAPLKYKGYTFYQSGYDPKRPDWTVIQVVRDPGVQIVFIGFLLLNAGIFLNLYFKIK